MPTIDSSLIPLVIPGSVFPTLTEDTSLQIRWLIAQDPHYFDVYNRPMGDLTVRQLIIAKSVDQLGLRLSHQANFPFLVPCTVDVATTAVSLPVSWIWDMHVSLPDTWESLKLARIQRFPGTSDLTDGDFTGTMRLIFTANALGSTSEVALFYVDYLIESDLTYQIKDIKPATIAEFPTVIPSNQQDTIAGFVILRTLDLEENADFFNALVPSSESPTSVTSGITVDPINYEITDTEAGGSEVSGDFSLVAISHGTGTLVISAYNVVPPIGVDENSVLSALNYPWRSGTSLTSIDSLSTVPSLLFSQFSLTAPQGNRNDSLEENFPVTLTRIVRLDVGSDRLQFIFSTVNTIIGSTSAELVEYASVVLDRSGTEGDVLEIVPLNNLRDNTASDSSLFYQNFGSGYCILSSDWGTNSGIDDFFDSFLGIVDEPADRIFGAFLDDFAVHRTPFNIPTLGEASALAGSTSRRDTPINPSDDNRYVTELDQGVGDSVNFTDNGLDTNTDIDNIGYKGGLVNKKASLLVNTANDAKFDYENDILPRLVLLLGRNPVHGDEWFDGTTFKKYDGFSNAWIG